VDRRLELLEAYNRELQHLRGMGGEFAAAHPKIASRLSLDAFECADPYVERLLEGFAFLAARVRLEQDAQFPRFTEHLLEMLHPAYLAPLPSMGVMQLEPDLSAGTLAEGAVVPRGTILRSSSGPREQTACDYRTAHDVTLWPVRVERAEYVRFGGSAAALDLPAVPDMRAALRIRLRAEGGMRFDQLPIDRLVLHLRGGEGRAMRLYEQLFANALALVVRAPGQPAADAMRLDRTCVRRVGFGDDEGMLPVSTRSFGGYRLLQEYFAFPARYMFVAFAGLREGVQRAAGAELEIVVPFDRVDQGLDQAVSAEDLVLHCTPAINLFPRRADRIQITDSDHEYHVVPDRTRPLDFEVYDVTEVAGYGPGGERLQEFVPFYSVTDVHGRGDHRAYYTLRRSRRRLPERHETSRTGHLGTETWLALVDGDEAPFRSDLRQLAVTALCTNRDLPLLLPGGEFTCVSGAPVRTVRCLEGPTPPRASRVEGEFAWRLVSHLSLNYLSLADSDERQGAVALRELLGLYGEAAEPAVRQQIEGVRSVASRPVLRRLPGAAGALVRGLEIQVTFDESAYHGSGVFLLGAVLEQFFARWVSVNAFTETVVRSLERGEIVRWPSRIGRRSIL
jgi:type VI secretion system protein ImpG